MRRLFWLSGRVALGASVSLLALAASNPVVLAATFGPISGTLTVRAGSHTPQSTPAVLGSASLSDNTFPSGIDTASSSLQTSLVGGRQFNFSGAASSLTNVTAPVGQPKATSGVLFEQSFTTAAPQWIELSANVLSPPTDGDVSAAVTLARLGQAAQFSVGHTAGATQTSGGAFAAGTFVVSGIISTAANLPGSHSGAVSGSLRIAAIADFDNNAIVNAADLNVIKANFGSTTSTFATGDLDGDGRTDGGDFLLWQRQFGTTLPLAAIQTVPEPSIVAFAAIVGVGMIATRRRDCR